MQLSYPSERRIPKYISRTGSKCYFSYDPAFFNANKETCIKLIAFYTLCLFGHNERCNDVLVSTARRFKKITLNECLGLITKNKLHNRVFHLPDARDAKLMGFFDGDALVTLFKRASEMRAMNTDDIISHHSCKVNRIHNKYPCMQDKFNIQVYKGIHRSYLWYSLG